MSVKDQIRRKRNKKQEITMFQRVKLKNQGQINQEIWKKYTVEGKEKCWRMTSNNRYIE